MMDGYALAIEGSTYGASVAVLREQRVVAERTLHALSPGVAANRQSLPEERGMPGTVRGEAERLMPAIAECMEAAQVGSGDIARIVCGAGPGSFTSLRVAASVAKGLAVGYGVELYAVPSLLLTVSGARPPLSEGAYLSVLDALRGEWFAADVAIRSNGDIERTSEVRLVSARELEQFARPGSGLRVVGPGQDIDARPHARGVAPILEDVVRGGPVDLASWEPDYGRLAEAQVRWEAAHGRSLKP